MQVRLAMPDIAELPGFDAAWDPAKLTALEGGILAHGDDLAMPVDPLDKRAGLLMVSAGTGSGVLAPEDFLGSQCCITITRLHQAGTIE